MNIRMNTPSRRHCRWLASFAYAVCLQFSISAEPASLAMEPAPLSVPSLRIVNPPSQCQYPTDALKLRMDGVARTLTTLSDGLQANLRELKAITNRLEVLKCRVESAEKELQAFRVKSADGARTTQTQLQQLIAEQTRQRDAFRGQANAVERVTGELSAFRHESGLAFRAAAQRQAAADTSTYNLFDRSLFLLRLAVALNVAQFGLLLGLVVIVVRNTSRQRVPVKERVATVERAAGRQSAEIPVPRTEAQHTPPPAPCLPRTNKKLRHIQHLPVPSPAAFLERLTKAAPQWGSMHIGVAKSGKTTWLCGQSTHQGQVRKDNQDYVIGFNMGDWQIGLIADGMGGLPYGRQASYLAVRAAALALIRQPAGSRGEPIEMAKSALAAASRRLTIAARQFHLGLNDGLRTTLIACVGNAAKWGIAYCGDGGAVLVRRGGKVESLLVPQKASPNHSNILAASLGPSMQGMPESKDCSREPGDFVVLMTDGVADRVPSSFAMDLLRAARTLNGNLQQVADQVLNELVEAKDALGFICDDNMSLICLGDGNPMSYQPSTLAKLAESHGETALHPTTTLQPVEVPL